MRIYLSVDQLIQINLEMSQSFGGTAGVRDRGALEAAAARPQNGYYRDVVEEGAALCESLLQNHPFVDGNKRTAITATAVFYEINGYSLRFEDNELYDWLTHLYNVGRVNKQSLAIWFRAHVNEQS
ncbi:MAG: type II toxin-antitoxin system death-on-curing family toxin [Acidobacteriaceae bacterium]|nr:type II toxin-antitoxin system death-on-curing family toxin [Acidobacteriaceae bacterium]